MIFFHCQKDVSDCVLFELLKNVNQTTASATFVQNCGKSDYLAATGSWGLNKMAAQEASNAALLEATLWVSRWAIYTRYEWVSKTVEAGVSQASINNPPDPLQGMYGRMR